MVDSRRRNRSDVVEDAREFLERFCKFRIFRGVLRGKVRKSPAGLRRVAIKEQSTSVRGRRKDARVGPEYFQLVAFKAHFAGNVFAQRPQRVRKRRGIKPRMKFLCDRTSADHFAAFEHDGPKPASCQVKRGDQRVVTSPDDHHFLSDGHVQFAAFFHSLRITWLAIRPLAPMIPPPGWVADPHI